MPLSVAILAHNEEANIRTAIESVSWADQVVVLDAESSDNTAEIARQLGADVLFAPNQTNLNINKNIAIEHCLHDWVFVLDADETISPSLAGEIMRQLESPQHDGYLVPRRNHVLGKWVRHGGQYPDHQLRLIRKSVSRFPAKHVHERIRVDGRVGQLNHPMDHFPYPTLAHMMRKGQFYTEFEAQFRRTQGRVSALTLLYQTLLRPTFRFIRRYVFKGGFLDGVPGLALAFFDAFNNVVRWLRIWEISQREGS